jgi:FdhD protein
MRRHLKEPKFMDDEHDLDPLMRPCVVTRLGPDASEVRDDFIAHEEPLEIQVQGASLAVIMRTPGADQDLAYGFLSTEGIIQTPQDVVSMRHCTSAKSPLSEENILRVVLAPTVEISIEKFRRNFFASSSCGLCGKATIDSVLTTRSRLDDHVRVSKSLLSSLPTLLSRGQRAFDRTGGLHGAGLFRADGTTVVIREDVGRHNAVDKVIGHAFQHGERGAVLFVSGRISFEIVQKAVAARIPVVAGISAPTSLAIGLGVDAHVAVIGFVRDHGMNVYSASERVAHD